MPPLGRASRRARRGRERDRVSDRPGEARYPSGRTGGQPTRLECVYWLNDARSRGIEPGAAIDKAQTLNQSAQQLRAPLVGAALLRNLDIAGKLGCLTSDNLDRMRHGKSPLISRGPYSGEPAEVDHIVPLAVEPALDREIANLELLPRTLNRRKGASMGARQWDYLEKFREADLLQPVSGRSAPASNVGG